MELTTLGQFASARARRSASPLILEYELTHLCNLSCQYCDRHTPRPAELSGDQIFQVLSEFYRLGMRYVGLDGGEPLAHRDFPEIVDWLVARGVTVHLNSNGILVPKHIETVRKVKQLKISLDGVPRRHDLMRGRRAFERAVEGALCARDAGVPVELRCVLGSHNVDGVDELVELVRSLGDGFTIMFQPARNSLFTETERDGSGWMAERDALRAALQRVEEHKRQGAPIANRWGSLRHFRAFPEDRELPCAAGWIKATLDPEGNLYHCGLVNRGANPANVLEHGVAGAFAMLSREGCAQCWCARAVEGNMLWGGQLVQLSAPLRRAPGASGG